MTFPPWLKEVEGGVSIELVVQPRASRTRLVGEHGDRLKLQITAPPVDGEANAAIVDFFSSTFRIPKRDVEIATGLTGKRKVVRIGGLDCETAQRLLASKVT